MTVAYDASYTEARANFKELLDSAADGRPAIVQRKGTRAAVVDAVRLRDALARLVPTRAVAVAEAEGWSIFIPGVPVAADAATFPDAVDEMVDALREYAEDWVDRLRLSANHGENWGLVQLVMLSTDEQLRSWLVAE